MQSNIYLGVFPEQIMYLDSGYQNRDFTNSYFEEFEDF